MKYITFINIGARFFFTVAVFVVIKKESDFWIVPILTAAGSIVGGIYALQIIRQNFGVRFQLQSLAILAHHLKEGWHVFVSSFGINIYINSNTLILGFFTNHTTVGYYSIAEKIILAIRGIAGMIFQAIYPYVCTLAKSKEKLRSFFRKLFIPAGTVFFVVGILIFFLSDWIVEMISGKTIAEASVVLKILSLVPFIVVANIPAYQSLLIFNLKNRYTAVLISGAIINVTLNIILCQLFQAAGTALSVLLTETLITLGLYFVLAEYNQKISREKTAHV